MNRLLLLVALVLAPSVFAQSDEAASYVPRTSGVHVLASAGLGSGKSAGAGLAITWTMGSSDRSRYPIGGSLGLEHVEGKDMALFDTGAFEAYRMTNVLIGADLSARYVQLRASAGVGRVTGRHYPNWDESEYVEAPDNCSFLCFGSRTGLGTLESLDAVNVPLRLEVLATPATRLFPWSKPGPRAVAVGLFVQHNVNAERSFTSAGFTLGGGLFR